MDKRFTLRPGKFVVAWKPDALIGKNYKESKLIVIENPRGGEHDLIFRLNGGNFKFKKPNQDGLRDSFLYHPVTNLRRSAYLELNRKRGKRFLFYQMGDLDTENSICLSILEVHGVP